VGCGEDEQAAAMPTVKQRQAAEVAVQSELPDTPIWEGTQFKTVVISSEEVCVDRIMAAEEAELFGGDRYSHVVVAIPSLETGPPQDGSCSKPEAPPNQRLSDEQLDQLAHELAAAVESSDEQLMRDEAERIKTALDKPLPVMTKKANLIHSATVAVLHGLQTDNPAEVQSALKYLNQALAI
jgi:hypothetical protein